VDVVVNLAILVVAPPALVKVVVVD